MRLPCQVYDGYSTSYNDNIKVKAVAYVYRLQNKATSKYDEIVKQLKDKIPTGFKLSIVDDKTFILDGNNYSLIVSIGSDVVQVAYSFDKKFFDSWRKELVIRDSTPAVAVDTIKK